MGATYRSLMYAVMNSRSSSLGFIASISVCAAASIVSFASAVSVATSKSSPKTASYFSSALAVALAGNRAPSKPNHAFPDGPSRCFGFKFSFNVPAAY
eukprot:31484-Pelagococcus_subviridis.AAC.13